MKTKDRSITLALSANTALIPLVQNVVEQAGIFFGMSQQRVLKLVMTGEEIIAYLAQTVPESKVQLTISPGGWCVILDFSFTADPTDLWIINLAAQKEVGSAQDIEHLGLLLAAKMMDNLHISLEGRQVHLELRLDYAYPRLSPCPCSPSPSLLTGPITLVDAPEPALIKEACTRVVNSYPQHLIPPEFATPGKVVDMVTAGALDFLVAVDHQGVLAGVMSWRCPSPQSIGFCGPYVFGQGTEVPRLLELGLLERVGRSRAETLLSELATPQLIAENFEPLGKVEFSRNNAPALSRELWFRLLKEDSGGAVWAHPCMVDFLEKSYAHLCLMRTICPVEATGERLPRHSVFTTRLHPELEEATFIPLIVGSDISTTLAAQVAALRQENYHNIFVQLDLAHGWQASMGGALMENGFAPRILLPRGGNSDILVFQHA